MLRKNATYSLELDLAAAAMAGLGEDSEAEEQSLGAEGGSGLDENQHE